jgi:hypothetical protein
MVWKIFATILVILFIIAMLFTVSPFKEFIADLDISGISLPSHAEEGDLEFVLLTNSHEEFSFSGLYNMTVLGAEASSGVIEINTSDDVILENYNGEVSINDNIILNGSASRVEIPGISFVADNILLTSSTGDIDNIGLKTFEINANGTIIVKGSETLFDGTIVINDFRADIEKNNETLSIFGIATSIEIPGSGLKFE